MEKKDILKTCSILFLLAILFTPTSSTIWISFLILGIVFGILWFVKEE